MAAVVKFEDVSNREDWSDQVAIYADNVLVDLSTATIVLAVVDPRTRMQVLLAQTADGSITVPALGIMQFTFPVSSMRNLQASKRYEIGCTAVLNGTTRELLTGEVAVYDGMVP